MGGARSRSRTPRLKCAPPPSWRARARSRCPPASGARCSRARDATTCCTGSSPPPPMPGRTIADAKRSGNWRRGLVALLLWLGFYGLGVGIAVALLSLPYAQTRFEGQVGLSGILCILAALTVL